MQEILLLSDTHSHMGQDILKHASRVDQVWHAGDIGHASVIDKLKEVNPHVFAVYGNIDGHQIRAEHPEHWKTSIEGQKIWMTHIGGYPNRYSPLVKNEIYKNPPDLFICGHSHILKVMPDKQLKLLHMNPGAIGISGFHKKRTMLKFKISQEGFSDLFVIEYDRKK